MPATKQKIEKLMKIESNPLVYLEYTPESTTVPVASSKIKTFFSQHFRKRPPVRFCMGYVSKPYATTYRITTCRHLITNEMGKIPSKEVILEGLEVFARYEGVNKRFHNFMFEDVDIKVHEDVLADILFIEITRPDNYNFQLLNQAAVNCIKRFPGNQVYYFQHPQTEQFFHLYEGAISTKKIYITGITNNGNFYFSETAPNKHYRVFHSIKTTKEVLIKGASGSPILSRKGEVVGMICAHDQMNGKGIYLSIEKIERLYQEIKAYHL